MSTEKILVPLLLPHIKSYAMIISSMTKLNIPIPTIDVVRTINRNSEEGSGDDE